MELNALPRPIRSDLAKVDRLIAQSLKTTDPFLRRWVNPLTCVNGKRVRPVLVLLTARQVGRVDGRILALAAAVEMLHAATLVHDDILDNAEERRHQKTLNFKWGNERSVLMGDFLLAATFRLMTRAIPMEILESVAEVAGTVCQGQIRETLHRYDVRLDEAGYRRVIADKTASLISSCCGLSARLAGASPRVVSAYFAFGYRLGMAFQVIDDTLDYAGTRAKIGKPVLSDLKEGRMTLPLLHCLKRALPAERRVLLAAVKKASQGRFKSDSVLKLLARHGSVEYARMKAWDFVGEAQTLLLRLPGRRPDDLLAYSEALARRSR